MPQMHRQGTDVDLVDGTCDFCGHRHACYVGGRAAYDNATRVTGWERHVCLGCLMRAGIDGGFDSCAECLVPTTHATDTGDRDA